MRSDDGCKIVFLSTHGKNDSEVPKELVTLLKYVKEDLEGSEKDFRDPYVEQLKNFICEIKGSKEWVKELKQHTQLALQSKSLEEFSDKIKV